MIATLATSQNWGKKYASVGSTSCETKSQTFSFFPILFLFKGKKNYVFFPTKFYNFFHEKLWKILDFFF